jgi:hypothetical protein
MSFITQPIRKDGFGAQYQTLINTILYCKKNNKTFVYTPIKNMEHNYDNDENFLNNIEELMNIKTYPSINTINEHVIRADIGPLIYYFDKNIENFTLELKELKENFWKNKDKNCFKNNIFNIAVHVRRQNPHDDDGWEQRKDLIPSDKYYLEKIRIIREKYKKDKILQFHIYSQGDISNFDNYKADDTILKINMNLFDTFKEMVSANALIITKSSFSYIAGVLSDGDVYYEPFWHPPMKHWHQIII